MLFWDPNKKIIKKLQQTVEKINLLEKEYGGFSIDQIKVKTQEFKDRLQKGETLDDILPESFALVRRAAQISIGLRHYDVQLMGGIVLHQGKIAEMRTGEGKTLVATLPAYLNALEGKGVHIVTVNDYLAKRDAIWMGQVYDTLGLSIGCVNHAISYLYINPKTQDAQELDKQHDEKGSFQVIEEFLKVCSKKEAYAADITFCTNNELGFDYLRDNMVLTIDEMSTRGVNFAIVDEVDSILIDEARTPLIISAPAEDSGHLYAQFAKIIPRLKENEDYNVDEKMRAVAMTEEGIEKVEGILGVENIYDTNIGGSSGLRYVHHLEQALRADALFKKDKDYVVKDGEVVIVDEFTGRLMPGRRYSEGLHQALEAKEDVAVQKESRTLASITFQNYFRLYKKLSGMTGTALTSAEEFHKVFKMDVVQIPTNKLNIRQDMPDLIYKTQKGKYQAVVQEVKKLNDIGRPVLVGTASIERNEYLSALLQREGIKHEVLNAKNHQREGEIIAQAGRLGAVTIATNMAGRGVDIILGGNPPLLEEAKKVREAGGLYVVGTERHEARRIDNQLRGRAGRQGDQGTSQFFISMEDDLMRIFGSDKLKSVMDTLGVPEDQPIKNSFISKSIESSQAKIEGFHFDTRNHVLQYDEVMNKQREAVYGVRRGILQSMDTKSKMFEFIEDEITNIVNIHTKEEYAEKWDVKEIIEDMHTFFHMSDDTKRDIENIVKESVSPEEKKEKVSKYILDLAKNIYSIKEKDFGEQMMREAERIVMLRNIDSLWMDHLENMDSLRDSVRLRAYGQKDPLIEFKNEGHLMFQNMMGAISKNIATTIFKVGPIAQPRPETLKMTTNDSQFASHKNEENTDSSAESLVKVGRNDPCPCGSGEKFKKCHGK